MARFAIQVVADPTDAVRDIGRVRTELATTENAGNRMAATFRQRFRESGVAAQQTAVGVNSIRTSLLRLATVAVGAFGFAAFVAAADQFTNIENRIRTVTTSTEQLNAVTDELFNISQRTRAGFQTTADVYQRTAQAGRSLGLTQREVLDFTESLNQAVALSGASAQTAQQGLTQFAQGLSAGALRGEELNSVLEGLPVIADVIAESMGVTSGQLRGLAATGALTSQQIITAFQDAREELAGRFANSVSTVDQAFVILSNSIIRFAGQVSQALNSNQALAAILVFVANNLETLAFGVTAFGAALIAANINAILPMIASLSRATGVTRLFGAALTFIQRHPVIAALTLIATLVFEMTRRFELSAATAARLTAVLDTVAAAGVEVGQFVTRAFEFIAAGVDLAIEGIRKLASLIGIDLVQRSREVGTTLDETLGKATSGFAAVAREAERAGTTASSAFSRTGRSVALVNTQTRNASDGLRDLAATGVAAGNDISASFDDATRSASRFESAARRAGSATAAAGSAGGGGRRAIGGTFQLSGPNGIFNRADFEEFFRFAGPRGFNELTERQRNATLGFGSGEFADEIFRLFGQTRGSSSGSAVSTRVQGLLRTLTAQTGSLAGAVQRVLDQPAFGSASPTARTPARTVTTPTPTAATRDAVDRNVFGGGGTDRRPTIVINNAFSTPDEASFRRSERQFNRRQATNVRQFLEQI